MTPATVLVAGIGNIFLGDDGFGSDVARQMAGRPWPPGVRVVDYGIRGFDVAFAIMDGYDVVILVDATQRGGAPGTLYVIEPDLGEWAESAAEPIPLEPHGMNPAKVFRLVRAMGGQFKRILVVGCEPAEFGPIDEGRIGLSDPVQAAVNEAIDKIESLVHEIVGEAGESRSALSSTKNKELEHA